jgi:hypothetical protein
MPNSTCRGLIRGSPAGAASRLGHQGELFCAMATTTAHKNKGVVN